MARITKLLITMIAGLVMMACGNAPMGRWETRSIPMAADLASMKDLGVEASVAAMETWNAASAHSPRFVWSVDTTPGNVLGRDHRNMILMGKIRIPNHEKDVAAAKCWWDDVTGEVEECDVILDEALPWTVAMPGPDDIDRDCQGAYDLQNLITHELGHVLGLKHGVDEDSTMFHKARMCEARKRSLEQSDLDALDALYP